METPIGRTQSGTPRQEALEAFVIRYVEKIGQEASGRSKQIKEVRQECQAFLEAEKGRSGSEKLPAGQSDARSQDGAAAGSSGQLAPERAAAVLRPLVLACSSEQPKLVEPALGCLHKLVAHAYLQGESGEEGRLDEDSVVVKVVSAIAKCGESRVEAIQLAVVRALLTAVTSAQFVLHGETLLQSVRAVYNLALSSESEQIRTTARSALSQTLSMILKRMHHGTMFKDDEDKDEVVDGESYSPDGGDGATVAEGAVGAGGEGGPVAAGNGECSQVSGGAGPGKQPAPLPPSPPSSLGVLERDTLNVVRSLCKLAMQEEGIRGQPVLLRGKLLAMDLLREVLAASSSAPVWESASDEFISVLRRHVCAALIRNSVSPLPAVFQLNANILGAIVMQRPLRAAFKQPLSTFYPKVMLAPLEEAAHPSAQHQAVVLRLMRRLCAEPEVLADLFVNYDCELGAPNLFERTAQVLADLAGRPGQAAKGGGDGGPSGPALRWASLQSLSSLLNSIAAWAGDLGNLKAPRPATAEPSGNGGGDSTAPGDEVTAAAPLEGSRPDSYSSDLEAAGASKQQRAEEVERLRTQKSKKEELAAAIAFFNRKPGKAIAALLAAGTVEDSPEAIARWLLDTKGLDKRMKGEYMGGHEDRDIAVMHAYVDTFDFTKEEFDSALRRFLSGFRLPGEAQKIDRFMEKFAARYCDTNPDVFKSADAAFVLAFAVIMLNTDAHSPQITDKMSCEAFVSLNAAAGSEGDDVPRGMLEAIYGRIVTNEIVLVEEGGSAAGGSQGGGGRGGGGADGSAKEVVMETVLNVAMPWRKASALARAAEERARDMHTIRDGMRREIAGGEVEGAARIPFHPATHAAHASPMLEECGPSVLVALRVGLEQVDDGARVEQMVDGVVLMVRLACALQLEALRDESLRVLTAAADAPLATSRECHVASLRAVLGLAATQGHLLSGAWSEILACASRLEGMRMRSTGVASDGELFFPDESPQPEEATAKEAASPFRQLGNFFRKGVSSAASGRNPPAGEAGGKDGRPGRARAAGGAVGAWLEGEGEQAIQRVYACSARLDSEAVAQFIGALCAVSHQELQVLPPEGPRVFGLNKLVECAYDNLSCRIRLVWRGLWNVLSAHLVAAACHPNTNVALYAVDSLRQLAAKLLERCELANFNFQSDALRPFVSIMSRCGGTDKVRELVVRCAAQAAAARGPALHSGWSAVFMVLAAAAKEPSPSLVAPALAAAEGAVPMLFDSIGGDCFVDCINCLWTVVHNPRHEDLSMRALSALRACGQRLAGAHAGDLSPPAGGVRDPDREAALLELTEHHWVPLLAGLAEQATDDRARVREGALDLLFELMHDYGGTWGTALWRRVYERVLEPLLDPVRAATAAGDGGGGDGGGGDGGGDEPPGSEQHQQPGRGSGGAGAADLWLLGASRAFVPRLCDLFARFYPQMEELLPSLLGVLLRCVAARDQALAAEGVSALRGVAACLGGKLGPVGWDAVLAALRSASDAARPDGPAAQPQQNEGPGDGGKVGAPAFGDELAVRGRCVVALMLQRTLGEVLAVHGHQLSGAQQVHVLDTLRASLLAASDLNGDAPRRLALQRVLRGGAEGWADAPGASQAGGGSPPPAEATADGGRGLAGPAGGGADGAGLPGLLRQEVEGCGIYLTAVVGLMPGGPGGGHDSAVLDRLLWLCRHVVQRCAACLEATNRPGPSPPDAWPELPAGDVGVRLALAGLGVEGEWEAGEGGSAVGWVEARREMSIRAPVLAVVLRLLARLQGEGVDAAVVGMMPQLAQLICAEPLSIRQALHHLFAERLSPSLGE